MRHGNSKEPWWKRRIQSLMTEIRRHMNILERKKKGDLKKDVRYKDVERKYFIRKKGLYVVLEELKQRLQAMSKKIKRYRQRIDQFRINKLLDLMISTEMVSKQTKKIPNWKCPGSDRVQGYWLKHLKRT